jgi:cysteine desulfurase
MDVIYLDSNATTRPDPQVVDAIVAALTEFYGNPSSVHRFGQRARHAVDLARAQVAALIGCGESELLLTGGGTEAVNTAIRGLLKTRAPRKRLVTTTVEHSATSQLCTELARTGVEIVQINVDQRGRLDLDAWSAAIDEQTALATAMWANNETGVLFPIPEMAAICRQRGVPFHCDGTQAVGKIPVDVKAAGLDAMTLAAHKFHGPKGVAALYIRRGLRVAPLVIGGPQELGRRGGTENVPGIVGMGKAAELAAAALPKMQRVADLRNRLERGILESIPETAVNGDRENRVPNTTNIGFAKLEAEAILLLLSEQGICASAGAACSSGSLEPSRILQAMKIPNPYAHGAVRFSLSKFTTDSEIDRTLQVLPGIIERLRRVLPVGDPASSP